MKSILTFFSLLLLFQVNHLDAAALLCEGVDGGSVKFTTGQTKVTIIVDGNPDILSFITTADESSTEYNYTYVITNFNNIILDIPTGNSADFDPSGLGLSKVYGLAYTGSLIIEPGDNLSAFSELSTECSDLSSNNLLVSRIGFTTPETGFFASSNTSGKIGVYSVLEDNQIYANTFDAQGADADGIFYDQATDVLYQLNRTDNVVNAYSNVFENFTEGLMPELSAISTSDFTNGREITVSNGKLVVAQDANDTNGGNKFIVYSISPTSITLDRIIETELDLWGIFAIGNRLYAVEDNSGNIAIFNDFFNQTGIASPSSSIAIEGLVRTHGLVYDAESDMMLLTDIGSADDDRDGALIRIKKFSTVSADGIVSSSEQIRVSGGSSLLGNPVDIALDKANSRVYVAERARNGGMVLCFKIPSATGGIAPEYAQIFEGASAIHLPGLEINGCDNIFGGTVSLSTGGTETTIIVDGNSDELSFDSSIDNLSQGFTYVVTDSEGEILGIPEGNTVDFDPAGVGVCRVYGLSYTGSLTIELGDNFFDDGLVLSDGCFAVSSNYITVNRIEAQQSNLQFYVSSNTEGSIGVFSIFEDGIVSMSSFTSAGMDADGIYYDEINDVLYQLNRSDNVINAYSNVKSSLAMGNEPMLSATSTSDFSNGREITFSNGKIVVAQDGNDTNSGNKFIVYDASPTAITLEKVLDADINLWGIQLAGNTLYAVVDNSNEVAQYENFLDQEAGSIVASNIVTVEGIVRTHGLTYISESDMMLLTDVGDADSESDGAIIRIKQYSSASADGMVSSSEQIRVSGGSSQLGNPVDIAFDKNSSRVYVAERKRADGLVLGFKLPTVTGGIAPIYVKSFSGASAIHFPGDGSFPCENIDGGMVSLAAGGTETTIVSDGISDFVSFESTNTNSIYSFTYVVTSGTGKILGIPEGNTVDFDPAGVGVCRVYGLTYLGELNITVGDNFLSDGLEISDDCFDVSDNYLTINRISSESSDLQFFTSSNTEQQIGIFSILDDNEIAMSSFASGGIDADGIYYDEDTDVLYQLNRSENVIDVYGSVKASLEAGIVPTVTTKSSSDFDNGREIAVIDNKLVVAQDASDTNDGNKLVVYDIASTTITLDKVYTVDINLWGIFATGNTLFAIEDNSSNVAIYSDFFNEEAGAISPTRKVEIADMVRTHGLLYDFHEDMLVLTDIGDADSDNDGAIVVIRDFGEVSADGIVSANEQARAFGGSSQLGNPVDIALDKPNKRVYVAERKKNGGAIYGFKLPKLTGGIAPEYSKQVEGASAIHLPGLEVGICEIANGGEIEFVTGGRVATIFIDDNPDVLEFNSSVVDPVGFNFTYVITDNDGKILGIPSGNSNDFNGAGIGICRVYGLSYLGDLNIAVGDNLLSTGFEISTDCSDISDKYLTVNRIAPEAAVNQVFASSNTASQIGVFDILAGNGVMASFIDILAEDADGIYYDKMEDVLYQLNRSESVINAYSNVNASIMAGATPPITATSDFQFTNGREITMVDGKLIVAQDASDVNSGNKFWVYTATSTSIDLENIYNSDINLWGITGNGSQLIAVEDNSNRVAIYDDFTGNGNGNVTADIKVTIENLVRTHGLSYDQDLDLMILTDIGDADSAEDGAIIIVENWSGAILDGVVTDAEQIKISGARSLLGNPVDVGFDSERNTIYVAERKNSGGRLLVFEMPSVSSDEVEPNFVYNFAGISSVFVVPSRIQESAVAQERNNITAFDTKLFPSPASQSINIALRSEFDINATVQIYDVTGALVSSQNVNFLRGENLININVVNLITGFHFVRIPEIQFSEKFLKIK